MLSRFHEQMNAVRRNVRCNALPGLAISFSRAAVFDTFSGSAD